MGGCTTGIQGRVFTGRNSVRVETNNYIINDDLLIRIDISELN